MALSATISGSGPSPYTSQAQGRLGQESLRTEVASCSQDSSSM